MARILDTLRQAGAARTGAGQHQPGGSARDRPTSTTKERGSEENIAFSFDILRGSFRAEHVS